MEMPLVSIPCFLANVSSGFSASKHFQTVHRFTHELIRFGSADSVGL